MLSDGLRLALRNVLMVHLLFLNLSSSPNWPACREKNNVQHEQTSDAPPESYKFNLIHSLFYNLCLYIFYVLACALSYLLVSWFCSLLLCGMLREQHVAIIFLL